MISTIEIDFIQAIKEAGLEPPDKIVVDGRIHRFSTDGWPSDKPGWYVLNDLSDGVIAGAFGCWRSIDKVKWSSVTEAKLDKQQQRRIKDAIKKSYLLSEQERTTLQEKIAKDAESVWEKAKPADPAHPYLSKKKVSPFNLRQNRRDGMDILLVPLFDLDGKLWSLQYIYPDGKKLFLKDGRSSGLMHTLGEPTPTRVIAEGFSTGASIHEATGHCVHIAFNCHNLKTVAELIRKAHPDTDLVIAADDDWKTEGNPGFSKGADAARSVKAKLAIPNWPENQRGKKDTDFNDLALSHGPAHIMTCIGRAARPLEEKMPKEDRQTVLNRLSELDQIEYDLIRVAKAKKLGIRASTLDNEITKLRGQKASHETPFGRPVEPWHDPVDGVAHLDSIFETLKRFIAAKPEVLRAAALWTSFTWFIEDVRVAPLAIITSPEKRCGKTLLTTLMSRLCRDPLLAINITPSALFRSIEKWKPTLILDEADTFLRENEDLRGLINSGHTRNTAFVIRCTGDNHEPTSFNTFGAKLLVGIGNLPETIMDRAVVLRLRRKKQDEKMERIRKTPDSLFDELCRKQARFSADHSKTIADANPTIPENLNDREQDNWEPLLAIADAVGGHWPETARRAAVEFSQNEDDQSSIAIQLLSDIRKVFSEKDIESISSVELIEALCADEERPWSTFKQGVKITARQLASKLSGFDIKSKSLRINGMVMKGYKLKDFEDSFQRYLVLDPGKEGLQVTNLSEGMEAVAPACNRSEDVTVTNTDPLHQKLCKHSDVTRNPKNSTHEEDLFSQTMDEEEIF
jgi:putative DNA primase/helicase